jgi:hypothetical protein
MVVRVEHALALDIAEAQWHQPGAEAASAP